MTAENMNPLKGGITQMTKNAPVANGFQANSNGGEGGGVSATACKDSFDGAIKTRVVKLTPNTARAYLEESWIPCNYGAWCEIQRIALRYASKGFRFSVSELIAIVRYNFTVNRPEGDPFKINNTMLPALARLLIELYPALQGFIEIRKSECDWAFKHE